MKAEIEFTRNNKTVVPTVEYQGTFSEITQMVTHTIRTLHRSEADSVSFRLHSMQYFVCGIPGQKETDPEFLRGLRAAIKMAVNEV